MVTFDFPICSFSVSVTASISGTEIDFFDESGAVVKALVHFVEQDTFSANGKTLTGIPYRFNVEVLIVNGEVVVLLGFGLAEKIRLPDGKLFVSAGVIDFLAAGGPSFTVIHGVTGDVNALCAALSP